ncbi:hypothetical protein B9Z55_017224 [Caenorhabditis nigoni]|uniref:DUF281 domain-containing protein n=1 Tax=Caenorhabditis nigoni TaxID=1611254 RepID=A0A2G5T8Z7_9PELO|nr:hypothetical protein B9Z55_017224 [Caenorhabditis nigoni]
MIIRFLFILISFQISLIEPCIRTIPPEEVYITSTPDNLPITEEPQVTSAPVTDAPITDAPITDAPVTDATDAPVNPENLCMECDIKAVSPNPTDPAITFTSKILSNEGDCLVTEMICERTDGRTCDNSQVMATTPTGQIQVTNSLTATMATTIISCNEDGTFSAGAANGITKLECYFENCVEPPNLCTECDTQAIEPNLADAATSFTAKTLSAPGSCVETEITCKREDDKTCTDVKIEAITPGGQSVITDSATEDSATSTITCAKDGTYSWREPELECIFENCEPPPDPCTTCDIQTIAPVLTDPDTSYTFTPLNAPGDCLLNQMTCKRTDDKICGSVKIVLVNPAFKVILNPTSPQFRHSWLTLLHKPICQEHASQQLCNVSK